MRGSGDEERHAAEALESPIEPRSQDFANGGRIGESLTVAMDHQLAGLDLSEQSIEKLRAVVAAIQQGQRLAVKVIKVECPVSSVRHLAAFGSLGSRKRRGQRAF
jgi:hypothetical protein